MPSLALPSNLQAPDMQRYPAASLFTASEQEHEHTLQDFDVHWWQTEAERGNIVGVNTAV